MGRSGGKNKNSQNKTISRSRSVLSIQNAGRVMSRSERSENAKEVLESLGDDIVLNDPALALALINHDEIKRSEFDNSVETTTDPAWIAAHGTDQVDISKTDFDDLPEDIKEDSLREANLILSEWMDEAELRSFAPMAMHPGSVGRNEEQFFVPVAKIIESQLQYLTEEIKADLDAGPNPSYEEGDAYWPDGFVPRHQQILDDADKEVKKAEDELALTERFASESKAIADHARWAAEKTSQNPEDVVKDIISNPSEYKDRIPSIAENVSDHSYDSRAIVSDLATKEIANPKEAAQDIEKYIQSATDRLDRANVSRDMKRKIIRKVPDNIVSKEYAKAHRAGHEKEMARRGLEEAASIASYAKWEAEKTGKSPEEVIDEIKTNPESYKAGIPEIAKNIKDHTKSSWQMTIAGAKDIVSGESKNSLEDYERQQAFKEEEALVSARRRSREKDIIQKVTDPEENWDYNTVYP